MNIEYVKKNQNMIFDIFKNAKKNDRLSHAYLFYGDEGTGKKEMAYLLSCIIYCDNGGCLECDTCRGILENNNLNVDYIGIAENKKGISKEQILDLQEEFSKTSLIEGTRIYIVDGIDTASSAAQNSLLKFIEEPINQTPTIGIFLARELSNVVSTIQSRCVLQHFKKVPVENIVSELTSYGFDELDSILAANLTNDIDAAKEIISSDEFVKTKQIFINLFEIENKKQDVVFYLNNVGYINGNNIKTLISWIILFLEDANLYNDNLKLAPLCDKIKKYRRIHYDVLKDKLDMVLDLSNRINYNVLPKNIFHELVTKLI